MFKQVGNIRVQQTRIIGTNAVIFRAWEPRTDHSSITTFPDFQDTKQWWGSVTSRSLPQELNDLPVGEERSNQVHAWQAANGQEAIGHIIEAFPHLADNPNTRQTIWCGEIEEIVIEGE